MEGPKRNPDRLNTIGIVTVGGVGAALVYLSIVGLQAFYVNDTSKVDEMSHFGTQEETRLTLKAEQIGNLNEPRAKGVGGPNNTPIYSIPIATAKQLIVRDAKVDASNLVPAIRRSDESTVQPVYGRPKPLTGAGAATGAAVPPPGGADLPTLSPTTPGAAPDGLAPPTPDQPTPAGTVPAAGAATTPPAPPVTDAPGAATPAPVTPPPATPVPAPAPARPAGGN